MKKTYFSLMISVLALSVLFFTNIVLGVTNIECYNDANCDDNNSFTHNECINPGTSTSDCIYEEIKCFSDSGCGANGYEEDKFCFIDDLFRDFKTFTCVGPGQTDSYCNINVEPVFYKDCGEDYCENFQKNYCIDKNVYHNRSCYDRGCQETDCFSNKITEEVLVKECELGCLNGTCVECFLDSDCNEDYFGKNYCDGDKRNELFQDLTDYYCTAEKKCAINITAVFIKDCGSNICRNYGSKYCKANEAYQNRTCNEQGCSLGECYNNTIVEEKLIAKCSANQKCSNGSCENNECIKDSDCNDNNAYTFDSCKITNGIGKCANAKINCSKDLDCGKDMYIGSQFCQDDKSIFKNFSTYKCLNPGTAQSSCKNTVFAQFLIGCGENFYSKSYCRNNNVYWNFNNNSCIGNGVCKKKVTQQLKETCQQGCSDGYCKECKKDEDCSYKNSCSNYSESYCLDKSVYKKRTCDEYSCQQYRCSKETKDEEILVSNCASNQLCNMGQCIACNSNLDCGTDNLVGDLFCSQGNVFQNFIAYTCNEPGTLNSFCSNSEFPLLINYCASDQICDIGQCQDIPPSFNIISPVQDSLNNKKVNFEIKVSDSLNPKKMMFADESLNSGLRLLCLNLKDNICKKSVSFKKGYHIIRLELTDKQGTIYTQRVGFNVIG